MALGLARRSRRRVLFGSAAVLQAVGRAPVRAGLPRMALVTAWATSLGWMLHLYGDRPAAALPRPDGGRRVAGGDSGDRVGRRARAAGATALDRDLRHGRGLRAADRRGRHRRARRPAPGALDGALRRGRPAAGRRRGGLRAPSVRAAGSRSQCWPACSYSGAPVATRALLHPGLDVHTLVHGLPIILFGVLGFVLQSLALERVRSPRRPRRWCSWRRSCPRALGVVPLRRPGPPRSGALALLGFLVATAGALVLSGAEGRLDHLEEVPAHPVDVPHHVRTSPTPD